MEQTASRIAVLPAQRKARARDVREVPAVSNIYWLRSGTDPRRRVEAKRIAVLDPFEVERRLLVALAEAQGHRVGVGRGVEHLLADIDGQPPQIAFVHICFEHDLRRIAAGNAILPPIVLIDPFSIAGGGQAQLAPLGDFTALRFPIGLLEFAEAIRRHAR